MKMFGVSNFWLPYSSGYLAMLLVTAVDHQRPLWIIATFAMMLLLTIATHMFMLKHEPKRYTVYEFIEKYGEEKR